MGVVSNGDTAPTTPQPRKVSRCSITELSPDIKDQSSTRIAGVVSLIWPYSSLTCSFAFLLADPDIRLRMAKGQTKVTFRGLSASKCAELRLSIGDSISLGLEGARWVLADDQIKTAGKRADWDLEYTDRVYMEVQRNDSSIVVIDVFPETAPGAPLHESAEITTLQSRRVQVQRNPELWDSPAFLKKPRLIDVLSLRLLEDEDGSSPNGQRKRTKFSRDSGSWRFVETSPTRDGSLSNGPRPSEAIPAEISPPNSSSSGSSQTSSSESEANQQSVKSVGVIQDVDASVPLTGRKSSPGPAQTVYTTIFDEEDPTSPQGGNPDVDEVDDRLHDEAVTVDDAVVDDAVADEMAVDEAEFEDVAHSTPEVERLSDPQNVASPPQMAPSVFSSSSTRSSEQAHNLQGSVRSQNNDATLPAIDGVKGSSTSSYQIAQTEVIDLTSPVAPDRFGEQISTQAFGLEHAQNYANSTLPVPNLDEFGFLAESPVEPGMTGLGVSFGHIEQLQHPPPMHEEYTADQFDLQAYSVEPDRGLRERGRDGIDQLQKSPASDHNETSDVEIDSELESEPALAIESGKMSTPPLANQTSSRQQTPRRASIRHSLLTPDNTQIEHDHHSEVAHTQAQPHIHLPISPKPSQEHEASQMSVSREAADEPSLLPIMETSERQQLEGVKQPGIKQSASLQVPAEAPRLRTRRQLPVAAADPPIESASSSFEPSISKVEEKTDRKGGSSAQSSPSSKSKPKSKSKSRSPTAPPAPSARSLRPRKPASISPPLPKRPAIPEKPPVAVKSKPQLPPTQPSPIVSLRTSLSFYPLLSSLPSSFSQTIDILAVITSDHQPPRQAKSGPKDYFLTLELADRSCPPGTTVTARLLRPYPTALPSVYRRGDVCLLRDMKVQTQGRGAEQKTKKRPAKAPNGDMDHDRSSSRSLDAMMLLSTQTSAWSTFSNQYDEDHQPLAQQIRIPGPPVEIGDEEINAAHALCGWWWQEGKALFPPQSVAARERSESSASGAPQSKRTAPKKEKKEVEGKGEKGEGLHQHQLRDGSAYGDVIVPSPLRKT